MCDPNATTGPWTLVGACTSLADSLDTGKRITDRLMEEYSVVRRLIDLSNTSLDLQSIASSGKRIDELSSAVCRVAIAARVKEDDARAKAAYEGREARRMGRPAGPHLPPHPLPTSTLSWAVQTGSQGDTLVCVTQGGGKLPSSLQLQN